jgi:hypothetical protein
MVDIAARATNGVILVPDRKQTRRAIIDSFKQNLTNLRKRLLVCIFGVFLLEFTSFTICLE